MNHYQKLKSLLLLLCLAITAKAQLSDGKVYNFVNVGKGTSMSITANDVIVTLPDVRKYSQLWYAASEGNGFTLRNLENGHYLKSPNAKSGAWSTVKEKDANCIFTATSVGGNYAIRVTGNSGGHNYMHADGGNTIVCWESSDANSQWTMDIVDIDAATLNANWKELASIDPSAATVETYQAHLDNLFSDKACTTLKKSFANENAVKNDADYKALPTTLQEMVLKVYKDSWAEDNYDGSKLAWGADYAKKYRVQLYEPYNEPEEAAKALGLNAHTNLNNPTGIFANDREALYVMVGGAIETGASLYITSYTGNGNLGGYDNGYELKQGLNIVPSFGDGNNYCINYVVHTFDTSKGKGNKAKAYRLSDFDDLKIHIEGGYINGYYNKMGDDLYSADKGANWDYLEARATQTTVTILGEYITLQFPLNDAVDNDGKTNKGMSYYLNQSNVEGIIDEWDRVMLWERLVLGLLDENTINAEAKKSPYSEKERLFDYTGRDGEFAAGYEDYYNVHGLSLGVGYNYMYGGWDHCGYHYNTMESILTNLPYNAGAHWGPGHEIGHQHQNLLTVNGLTEVTNNLFANVVLWYYGETTSRYNGSDGALSNVLAAFNTEGSDFFTNNIWALTHMYYKLFLYYHVLGHNTKFYPTLFEMLRQDPMSTGYAQDGATTLLHFYKKCCLASGDDLTEFFRAHGFFSAMDNRLVGDYSNSVYTTTKADINAAIKEVKALGYEENIAVLFINDATGETIESHKGDNLETYGETTICAEVGGYASFTANADPDYTYSVAGTTVTMEGEGGTGFAIFNEKGELIAFSDKKTFEISSECAAAIASGKAEIKTIKADNTPVGATDVMDTDKTEAKRTLLGELLDAAKAVTDLADADGKKVGYYRPASLTDLEAAYAEAKTVYDNQTSASYAAMYDVLFQAYAEVVDDDFSRIGIVEGNAYRLTNKAYPSRSMAVNTSNDQMYGIATADNDAQKWYFEASESRGRYYLKNKATSKYPGDTSTGAVLSANKTADTKGKDNGAYAYELRDMGNGIWALVGATGLHCSSSQSYNIVGWGADADASQWYITAVEVDQNAETLYELQTLITKTEALVDEMATVQYKGGAIDMSTCTITSNATEPGHETKYLTDGNPNTFFHTIWSGSAVGDYHNIVIDLGEGHSLAEFALNYKTLPTTSNNVDAPESLTVQGSNDGSSYTDIAALSNGLPTTKGAEYTSSTLRSASQAYRYIRLQVKTATGGKLGSYYYFGLAELSLLRMTTLVDAIGDKYQNFVTADALKAACDQVYAAQQTIASGSATSDDIAALQAQYNILLAAYENANNVEFNAKKQELLTLISNTNSLINTCGTVTYTSGKANEALALQTTNPYGDNYLSTNAQETEGTHYLSNILDYDNANNHFHSAWTWDVNEVHHLKVDLGNGKSLNEFTFTYRTATRPYPYEIRVYGSNDDASYVHLATFSKNDASNRLPTTTATDDTYKELWTSSTISSDVAYRYLRFDVTNSGGTYNKANPYGEYCFTMSYFGVTAAMVSESYTVELGNNPGDVTEDLLLTSFKAVQAAQAACDRANTEAQLQSAIESLLTAKDALHSAMYSNVEYTISVVGAANGGVEYKGENYTESLSAPTTLTIEELSAIGLDGYVAEVTLEGQTITIIYNKVYIVSITGGEGAGRLTFNETEYANGETFNALQGSFTAESFTIKDVTGYTKSEVTVNHETGVISVTYTLDKTALEELIDETNELIQACQVFVNSAYVTELLLTNTSAAITSAMGTLSEENLTYAEYTEALSELQAANTTLTEAKALAEQEADDRNTQRGVLNELIASTNDLITTCGTTPGDATQSLIDEVSAAVTSAQAVAEYMGSTVEQLTNATTTLQGQYDVLLAAQQSTAKAELRALIEQAEVLIAECGEVANGEHEVRTPIALQTTDKDAAYYLSTNAQEQSEGPIANLVDNQTSTFFHSSWKAAVKSAHYLQVDMGNGQSLQDFVFSYTTRKDNGPHPEIIVVSGSNSLDDPFEEIKTFDSGLPTAVDRSWETAEPIKATKSYRYLRFSVTKATGGKHGEDEYFFAMSEFDLSSVSYENSYYVESILSYGNVTEDLLLDVFNAKVAAESCANNSYDANELEGKKADLQAVYDNLLAAHNDYSYLPVTLTTDMESPVLYMVNSKRGDNKLLQYDPAEGHMFSIVDATIVDEKVEANLKQLFYFTKGTVKGQVYIHPFAAGGKVLTASNKGNGAAKVFVAEKSTAEAMLWTFEQETIDADVWYSLKGVDAPYFSHYGGGNNKMGFYDSKDEGSRLRFTDFDATTIEGSYAYHTLKLYYDEATRSVSENVLGYYRGTEAYETACNRASAVLEDQNSTDADYLAAYNALFKENEVLEMILPEEGKFYRIISADSKNGREGGVVYANPADNKLYWDKSKTASDATAIWTIIPAADDFFKVANLHTGTYMNGFIGLYPSPLNEVAGDISIVSLSDDGQMGIKCNDAMMHAQASSDGASGAIVSYSSGANDASAWRIVEVTEDELSLVEFALTISQYRHAGLYLNYSAVIPEGVKVYIAHTPDGQKGTILADELDGTILPARTAVIVKGNADEYKFKYTAEEYDGTNNLNENLLGGSAYLKYQQVKESGNLCCVFGQKEGEVGLYKNWVGYSDANGTLVDSNGDDKANEDDGSYFKVSANKIYYEYKSSAVAGAAFRFRFNTNETTELDGLMIDEDATIYNLCGQRLLKVVEPGIYIINGKKTFVTEKMIRNND